MAPSFRVGTRVFDRVDISLSFDFFYAYFFITKVEYISSPLRLEFFTNVNQYRVSKAWRAVVFQPQGTHSCAPRSTAKNAIRVPSGRVRDELSGVRRRGMSAPQGTRRKMHCASAS